VKKILVLLCVITLTACGFQLRGNYALPFDTFYIDLPENNEVYAALKRGIEAGSKTKVMSDRDQAQAWMVVTNDRVAKSVLSLSSAGRVREFQLIRTFSFRVIDSTGREIIPQRDILLRRDLPYSDKDILAKEYEEALLTRDMQSDLVNQILRRLAAANLGEPTATTPATGVTTNGNAAAR
jgi:LPS-assembly lipoprotein